MRGSNYIIYSYAKSNIYASLRTIRHLIKKLHVYLPISIFHIHPDIIFMMLENTSLADNLTSKILISRFRHCFGLLIFSFLVDEEITSFSIKLVHKSKN